MTREHAGGPRLQILVERADVGHYKKALEGPFFALALRDASGELLEKDLATPPGHFDREAGCITADHPITLRTPVMDVPEGGFPPSTAAPPELAY